MPPDDRDKNYNITNIVGYFNHQCQVHRSGPASQAKGTNSTLFLTYVMNKVELLPLACEDEVRACNWFHDLSELTFCSFFYRNIPTDRVKDLFH